MMDHNKYLPILSMVFYTFAVVAALIGQKIISVGPMVVSAGSFIFPFTYVLMAAMTEIYGFEKTRPIILSSIVCNILTASILYYSTEIDAVSTWANAEQFNTIFHVASQIIFMSIVAYGISEYVNSLVLSNLGVFMHGRWFLLRALSSNIIAIILDTLCMLPVMVINSPGLEWQICLSLIAFKIVYEIIILPIIWLLVLYLRKYECIYRPPLITNTLHACNIISIASAPHHTQGKSNG